MTPILLNVSSPSPDLPAAPQPVGRRLPAWVPALIFVALIVLDQMLKGWALSNLRLGDPAIPFIPGLLDWQLTFNTGAAWSMFSGSAKILAVGRLLVGLGILGYLFYRPQNRFLSIVLSMIAAGAVGNAIDGIRLGKVTDMLHSPALSAVTKAINGSYFPIFNLADSCVVLGTLLLLAASFLPQRQPRPLVAETARHEEH